jgi:hypothetical protein
MAATEVPTSHMAAATAVPTSAAVSATSAVRQHSFREAHSDHRHEHQPGCKSSYHHD